MASMFGVKGISTLETPQSAITKSVHRRNVKVTSSQGEIAMPMISADTYRLSIQVPASWPIPSAPRTSFSATDVTWSLNSDVIAAMRTPQRPNNGLISMGCDNSFFNQSVVIASILRPVRPVESVDDQWRDSDGLNVRRRSCDQQ